MNFLILNFITALILFFLVSPGILTSIPQKGSKLEKALVHALIFAVIFVVLQMTLKKLLGYVEGLDEKVGSQELFEMAKSPEIFEKALTIKDDPDAIVNDINLILKNDPKLFTDLGFSLEDIKQTMSRPDLKQVLANAASEVTASKVKSYMEQHKSVLTDPSHRAIEEKLGATI